MKETRKVRERFLTDQVGNSPLSRQAYNDFLARRALMLINRHMVFMGMAAQNLIYVEADYIPTLGTDGVHIYVNPAFFMKLKNGERIRGVAHEVHHAVSMIVPYVIDGRVIDRRGDRDPELWNIAADHNDNLELERCGIGDPFTTIQVYQDPKYDNWSTEKIFDDLVQNPPPEAGRDAKQFDFHFEIEIDDGEAGDEEQGKGPGDQQQADKGTPTPGKGKPGSGAKQRITAEVYADIVEQAKQTLIRAHAAQMAADADAGGIQGGTIPSGMLRRVETLMEPRYDWCDILRDHVERVIHRGYSIETPNKAYFNQGFTFEGNNAYRSRLNLAMFADGSGSVDPDAFRIFMSEMRGVLEQHRLFKALLGTFDADVHEESVRELTEHELDEFEEFHNNARGGGGTVFGKVFEWLDARQIVPRLLVIWTDGEPWCEDWGWPDYCPTLFVVKPFPGHPPKRAPFGDTIFYTGPSIFDKDTKAA